LLLLMPAIARAESSSTAEPVLTVCQVLQRLNSLRGKMIAVRGGVVETWGNVHGPYVRAEGLRGPSCPGIPDAWRPVLLLDRPTPGGGGTFSASFDRPFTFQEQPPTLTALLARMRAEGPNSDYIVTLIGELVTKEDLSIVRLPNGLVKGNGYQGGAFPAVLLVQTVRNPVRKRARSQPQSDYCSDIGSIDFGNRAIVSHVPGAEDRLDFHDGSLAEAFKLDDGTFQIDMEYTIEGDSLLHPTPGVVVRFIEIEQMHDSPGSWNWLFGFTCSEHRIHTVLEQMGEGMDTLQLLPAVRLQFRVWGEEDRHCCPCWLRESTFGWDSKQNRYAVRSTSRRRSGDPTCAKSEFQKSGPDSGTEP
jgi:hypothetical protein